jgi:Holliday junction DNA helicase RuvA
MIGYLAGRLVEKTPTQLSIDVNGVGYEVQASLTTYAALPDIGDPIKLLTHFVVREDAQLLYGFAEINERKLFRALIKISGVGPKLALAILSGMDVAAFNRCVLAGDSKSLTRLPGVGKKTAERLIVEMKDRMPEWHDELSQSDGENIQAGAPLNAEAVILAETETALIALGYKPVEASKAVAKLAGSQLDSAETAIRAALQAMLNR